MGNIVGILDPNKKDLLKKILLVIFDDFLLNRSKFWSTFSYYALQAAFAGFSTVNLATLLALRSSPTAKATAKSWLGIDHNLLVRAIY